MKKEELSFFFDKSGSLTNNREKFMKHNRNVTCKCKSVSWIDYHF